MKFQIYGWYFTSFILKIVKGKWIPFKGELARAPQTWQVFINKHQQFTTISLTSYLVQC